MPLRIAAFLIAAVLAAPGGAPGSELYFTDFESFEIGPDKLVGTGDWDGTNVGEGVHGIDNNAVPLIGKSAYVGRATPSTNSVLVYQPIDFDPTSSEKLIVDFTSFVGVENSTNGKGDIFYLSFFNREGNLLAALAFDNRIGNGRPLWRYDGASFHATGDTFLHGELQSLRIRIDFENNRWSVILDTVTVFIGDQFTATNEDLDLGSIGIEWVLTQSGMPGNNWFLFDQWDINAEPPPVFEIGQVSFSAGEVSLAWIGEEGFEYQVEYTDGNFTQWRTDLPNSKLEGAGPLNFSDSSPGAAARFYRLCRTTKSVE